MRKTIIFLLYHFGWIRIRNNYSGSGDPGKSSGTMWIRIRNTAKDRITQQNHKQNRKYFNPVISGSGRFELEKERAVVNLVGLSI